MKNGTAASARERLAAEKASLDYLELQRIRRGDPNFGKALENKTVWRELLDLELQDADERIRRLRDAAQRLLAEK